MTFKVYIPARLASTRLPGKALLELGGQTMLERVHAKALQSGALEVVIATDDSRIADIASDFGATVCMTAVAHQSGTERIAEAVQIRGEADDTIIVNLQGDEPFMSAAVVRQVAHALDAEPTPAIATVCEPIASVEEWRNPNVVKVVRDDAGRALYFSRAPVPWPREGDHEWQTGGPYRRHIGLYAYRVGFLQQFVCWPPAALEQLERLEQLRAMAHGAAIVVPDAVEACGIGIDTPEDLARARALLASARNP
jgi:3-deoxy-manno-octulosonate cytidylyltransferase (CMP-KDO synthetase)